MLGLSGFSILKLLIISPIWKPDFLAKPFQFNLLIVSWPFWSDKDIPRTKSGKIVELAVKNTIEGNKIKNKEALANPEVLDYFKNLKELNY